MRKAFCYIRVPVVFLVLAILTLGATRVILRTDWLPWWRTVRNSAHQQMEGLVRSHQLELQRVEVALENVHSAAAPLAEKVARFRLDIERLMHDKEIARREVNNCKVDLALVSKKLEAKEPIRLVSGRVLTPEEVALHVDYQKQRIGLAEEKCGFLDRMVSDRQRELERLVKVRNAFPFTLTQLEMSRDFLAEKIKFYEQQLASTSNGESDGKTLEALVREAQKTLEKAHAEIDVRLEVLKSVESLPIGDAVASDGQSVRPEEIVDQIKSILGENRLQVGE